MFIRRQVARRAKAREIRPPIVLGRRTKLFSNKPMQVQKHNALLSDYAIVQANAGDNPPGD